MSHVYKSPKKGKWLALHHRTLSVMMKAATDSEIPPLKINTGTKPYAQFGPGRWLKVRYTWTRRRGRWFLNISPVAVSVLFERELEMRQPFFKFPKLTIKPLKKGKRPR